MATLGFVLSAFLDPIQAGIVLAVVLLYRDALPVVVAGVSAAVVSETAMAIATDTYTWGEDLPPRTVSALMQAAILWWAVRWVRSVHSGGGPSTEAGGAGAATALAPLGKRHAQPTAPAAPPRE
jgi:hypothetical protein